MRVALEVPARARKQRHAAPVRHVYDVHGIARADQVPAYLRQERGADGRQDVRGPLDPRGSEGAA